MDGTGFETVVEDVEGWLAWAPSWLFGLVLLTVAGLLALLLHQTAVVVLRRTFGLRHPFLRSLFHEIKGPTRLAAVVFALGTVLPSAPFDRTIQAGIGRVLLLAFIVLAGWMALTAAAMAADLYLRRFKLDVEDNLQARKHVTQVRILKRALDTLIIVITASAALMTFESVRQYGVSLFASAGIAGIAVGFAARPVLANLIAGVQLAVTQPIRIDDAVVVENEWGWIEEITATYVVVRLWDWRRLIVPLSYFIEKPFQNWTREGSALIGTVMIYLDYSVPISVLRKKVEEIVGNSVLWDRRVVAVQVTDFRESVMEVRILVSASNAGRAFDIRCEVREKLIAFLQEAYPAALPRLRAEFSPAASKEDGVASALPS